MKDILDVLDNAAVLVLAIGAIWQWLKIATLEDRLMQLEGKVRDGQH